MNKIRHTQKLSNYFFLYSVTLSLFLKLKTMTTVKIMFPGTSHEQMLEWDHSFASSESCKHFIMFFLLTMVYCLV